MTAADDALDRLPMVPHVFDDAAMTVHAENCWGCVCDEAVATVRDELQRLREERDARQHRCVFPACVDGEKPERCGHCGDAERAEAAVAEVQRLREELSLALFANQELGIERDEARETLALHELNETKRAEAAEERVRQLEAANWELHNRNAAAGATNLALDERVRQLQDGLREYANPGNWDLDDGPPFVWVKNSDPPRVARALLAVDSPPDDDEDTQSELTRHQHRELRRFADGEPHHITGTSASGPARNLVRRNIITLNDPSARDGLYRITEYGRALLAADSPPDGGGA